MNLIEHPLFTMQAIIYSAKQWMQSFCKLRMRPSLLDDQFPSVIALTYT